MKQLVKKAILVVSFGTSYHDTRKKTLDQIESDIDNAFPDYTIYRAYTSKVILKKLWQRDGLKIYNVIEAMQQIAAAGITELIVAPTHVINGIENDIMINDIMKFHSQIPSIKFSDPLLTTTADYHSVVQILMNAFADLKQDEMLIFMGHGTTHYANSAYAALDYTFKDSGYPNVCLGTVEAYPEFDSVLKNVLKKKPKRILLTPFMIVAGDHANNDMASDEPDSWRSMLDEHGYNVTCIIKGLGEYKEIRDLFIEHIKREMEN